MINSTINKTIRLNGLSMIPGLGQVIGAATIIENTAKIALDCFSLLANRTKSKSINREVAFLNQKEKLRLHAIYAGMGFIRALPVVGGYALYMTGTAPQVDKIWSSRNNNIIIFSQTFKTSPAATEKRRLINLTLAMPVCGQVVGCALAIRHLVSFLSPTPGIAIRIVPIVFFTPIFFVEALIRQKRPSITILEFVQPLRADIQTALVEMQDDLVELSLALTAIALPVIGGATLYATDTYPQRSSVQYTTYLFNRSEIKKEFINRS